MIRRILVANRAEIASRVFATCRRLGIETVAVCSDADAGLPYVAEADRVVRLPGNTPAETYLRGDLILDAARRAGADAIHPGYGFLSENAEFARAVGAAGLIWIGPSPTSIVAMGSKIEAKAIMKAAGVPVLESWLPGDIPGGRVPGEAALVGRVPGEAALVGRVRGEAALVGRVPGEAGCIETPLLIKASAGGGGRGMRIVRDLDNLDAEIAAAQAEAASAFGDGTVFVEPYVEAGRHIEVQLMSTTVVGDRDCSVQRRHQKVIEEAPAPGLPNHVRARLHDAARLAAEAIDYRGAGTVEFLYDPARESFYFLETNTRLQVEHPVTEAVTGRDLVADQIAVAEGGFDTPPSAATRPTDASPAGHAIEARIYAEDPADGYLPQTGVLTRFEFPDTVRVDAGFTTGSTVSPFYDAMLAKVIAHGSTREAATRTLIDALRKARIHGVKTNRDQLIAILSSPEWAAAAMHTSWLDTGGPSPADAKPDPELARIAAAIAIVEAAKAARGVQQRIPTGWRNVTSQPQQVEFTDGTSVSWYGARGGYVVAGVEVVSIQPLRGHSTTLVDRVPPEGRCIEITARALSTIPVDRVPPEGAIPVDRVPPEGRCIEITASGVVHRFEVVIHGDPQSDATIDIDGPDGHIALHRKPRFVDPTTQIEPGSLTAAMPGTVTAVMVAPGDEVAAGQPILTMEAMKMQHTITAGVDGIVDAITAQPGSQVAAGDILAHLTPKDTP